MIPQSFAGVAGALADFGPALANHLWQSTVFVAVAGMLTLALRKNHARARYWIWMVASVKFLVPFALLIAIGSHLAKPHEAAATQAGMVVAMEDVSEPFALPATPVIAAPVAKVDWAALLPVSCGVVWCGGFVGVLCLWCVRWRRIARAMREAVALREGRELDALRRLEVSGGLRSRIELVVSPSAMEPRVFGIARPVLAWPARISERLDDAHLAAVLAHEVYHVRRRDNLTAAIHMVVEAVFWFYPLVWWLGARLVEERERACDEEVLELCKQPEVYAESILKVCEFCVESPLACVSGVTGADLKKRIVEIMTERVVRKLSLGRKLLLVAVGLAMVTVPIVLGQAKGTQALSVLALMQPPPLSPRPPAPPSPPQTTMPAAAPDAAGTQTAADPTLGITFDVVSIRLSNAQSQFYGVRIPNDGDSISMGNYTVDDMVRWAYHLGSRWGEAEHQDVPKWTMTDRYDIQAKVAAEDVEAWHKLNEEARRLVFRKVLAERFKVACHFADVEVPVYNLVIVKGGVKMTEAKPDEISTYNFHQPDDPNTAYSGPGMTMRMTPKGPLTVFQRLDMPSFAKSDVFASNVDRPVIDKTGLTGVYNFVLDYSPQLHSAGQEGVASEPTGRPDIITAIQKQLGLKLEPGRGLVQQLIVDHVERPSEN